jgi:hypothetical protein
MTAIRGLAASLGLLALGACASGPDAAASGPLAWMTGCWISADGANTETWSAPRGGLMFGHAVTMKDGAVQFFEQSRIDLRKPRATYTASPDGQRPITFTQPDAPVAADAVSFENAEHDYPQRIAYRSTGRNSLVATISLLDGSRPTNYSWTRCD